MGIVVSMLMITAGAVMRYAVTVEGDGFNVHTTGVILMVVGVIGALLSIGFWASWGGFGGSNRTVTRSAAPAAEQVVVTERTIL